MFWRVTTSLLSKVRPGVTTGLRGKVQPILYEICRIYCDYYDNVNYDPEQNGEYWLLSRLRYADIQTIFDVGANRGKWSATASRLFPGAVVHAFEIVPDTFVTLSSLAQHLPTIRANAFGLSDRKAQIQVQVSNQESERSSILPVDSLYEVHNGSSEWKTINCLVVTGDSYCRENMVGAIDFLKIDVEGTEYRVLLGLETMLREGRVAVIQFEFGAATLLLERRTIADFWRMLTGYGFAVGKLMPAAVDFTPYSPRLESKWANLIAIHESREGLLRELRSSGGR
jgi:FkbM family methyltransferase